VIDLSKLQTPAWQRVVAELMAEAPDDKSFLARLTSVLGQVSGARQASLLAVAAGDQGEEAEPRVLMTWPATGGQGPAELEERSEVVAAARAAGEGAHSRVFGLEKPDNFYDGSAGRGFVVALPVGGVEIGIGARPVITLLLDARSEAALRATLAQLEVLVGYSGAHSARQQLRRTRAASAALDLATRLVSSINSAGGFKGAAFQVVNDLSRQVKADRVALGWRKEVRGGDAIKVMAISDTEHIDRRMAMVRKLQSAMEECMDQEQPVMHPAPPARPSDGAEEADALLAGAITHAHRDMASADARLKVASLPLRSGEETIGVVTIESAGEGHLEIEKVELLQAALDLISPVLEVRKSDDRPLPQRSYDGIRKAGGWLVGPKHTVWKLAGLALMALIIACAVVRVPYRVEATMELQPRETRVVASPFEGVIKILPSEIKPGARVEQGDLLFELDTYELELRANQAATQMRQALAEADAARRQGADDEEAQAELRAQQAREELELYRYNIGRARVTAPISGTIIEGDLRERVGSPVRVGDALMRIARLDDMVVVARVDDRDIRLVKEAIDRSRESGEPLTSAIATKAAPAKTIGIEVTDIIPLAQPEEGVNAFEVRAELAEPAHPWMRPGMEGIAKLDTGERTILGIGSRRIVDTLRLWLWR
jgi:biotin carboxyl carrier protein